MNISKIAAACILGSLAASAQAADFTGAHVEIRLGYEKFDAGIDPDGVTYGGQIGYSKQIGDSFVAGLEVGFSDSSTKALGGFLKTDRDISVTLKLGPKLGENSLLYLVGGFTNLKIAGFGTDDGFRIGAGFEQALSDRFFVSTEYNYSDYGGGARKHETTVGAGVRF